MDRPFIGFKVGHWDQTPEEVLEEKFKAIRETVQALEESKAKARSVKNLEKAKKWAMQAISR